MTFCACLSMPPPPPIFTIDCYRMRLRVTVHQRLSQYHLVPMLYLRNQPDPLKSLRALFGIHATVDPAKHCARIHVEKEAFLDVAEMREAAIL